MVSLVQTNLALHTHELFAYFSKCKIWLHYKGELPLKKKDLFWVSSQIDLPRPPPLKKKVWNS